MEPTTGMKYIELLQKHFDFLNNMPSANEPCNYEVFSGIKHKDNLFNKVEKMKTFDISSFDYYYVVEIWKGDVCAFRDFAVHNCKIGLNKLENDAAERVISSVLCTAIESTIKLGEKLKKDEA